MSLNEKQQIAFYEAIDQNNPIVFINGENGTGKTYTIAKIIQEFINQGKNVVVSAPSHKAKSVITQELDKIDPTIKFACEIQTTQSALGFAVRWNQDKPFLSQVKSVNPIDVLIIDECSMMQNSFWKYAQFIAKKIILLGDELQLLSIDDCVDLSKIDCKKVYLTEQMRLNRKDSVLYNNITKFRKLASGEVVSFDERQDDTFEFVKSRNEIIDRFLDIKTDSKVIIAFTNEAVDSYNMEIKKKLGSKEFIEKGDVLIAQNRWTRHPNDMSDTVNNGSMIDVIDVRGVTEHYVVCDIECDGVVHKDVNIVRNPLAFKAILDTYASRIKSHTDGYTWKNFYQLKDTSLEVKHTYAITAYKSQGSTYDYVFYDHADALRFPKIYNPRNSLVALSRAKEKAFVFNNNGG